MVITVSRFFWSSDVELQMEAHGSKSRIYDSVHAPVFGELRPGLPPAPGLLQWGACWEWQLWVRPSVHVQLPRGPPWELHALYPRPLPGPSGVEGRNLGSGEPGFQIFISMHEPGVPSFTHTTKTLLLTLLFSFSLLVCRLFWMFYPIHHYVLSINYV